MAKYKVSTIVEAKDETDAVDKTAGFLWSWAKMYQLVHPVLKTRAASNRLGFAFSQRDNRVGGRVMAKPTFSGVKITKLPDGDLMFFMYDQRDDGEKGAMWRFKLSHVRAETGGDSAEHVAQYLHVDPAVVATELWPKRPA